MLVAWYIPPSWFPDEYPEPTNLLEAAQLASLIAKKDSEYLDETAIPSIVHQTWKSTDTADFPDKSLDGIEKWLEYAVMGEKKMAYFMWDDKGVRSLLRTVDQGNLPRSIHVADILPRQVEVADLFRATVCNTIGGVVSLYANVAV